MKFYMDIPLVMIHTHPKRKFFVTPESTILYSKILKKKYFWCISWEYSCISLKFDMGNPQLIINIPAQQKFIVTSESMILYCKILLK